MSGRVRRLLITGMSGLIGGLVGATLAKRYEVRALNRRTVPGFPTFVADISDFDAIRPAFEGVHTVIHLAACVTDLDDFQKQLATNIIGTYNIFEAARLAGVKRIVYGGSGAAVQGYEREEPILAMVQARYADFVTPRPILTHLSPLRPVNIYGCAKIWGEALGRLYSDIHKLSVLCIRIGRVVEEDRPRDARHAAVYFGHRDVVQMFERCVEAPESLKFDIFYGVSNNRARFRDLEYARDVIGYEPQGGIQDWPEATP
jgi:nucleoside-diphosphate-sugar epimerase